MAYHRKQWNATDERLKQHRFEKRRAKMTAEEVRLEEGRLLGRAHGGTDVSHLTGETGGPGPKPGEVGYVQMPKFGDELKGG